MDPVAPVPQIKDDATEVEKAWKRVAGVFKTGKTLPYAFRVSQLQKLYDGMTRMSKELNTALENDLGKGQFVNWAFEILICQRDIKHSIDHLKQWMKAESVDTPFMIGPGKSYTVCEPLGVTGILGSWNYPLVTTIMPLIAAMAAGNCVVLKPSEISAYSSVAIK